MIPQGEADQDSVDIWIERLKSPTIDASTLRKFKVVISSKTTDWMEELMSKDGLRLLIESHIDQEQLVLRKGKTLMSAKDDDIEIECLRCIKAFMNSEYGLNIMLENHLIVEKITLWFTSKNDVTVQLILDILTVICWVSDEGHVIICDAMKNYQRKKNFKTPFTPLVQILRDPSSTNVDLKTSVMTFINAIINSFHLPEARTHNRTYLLDEDIMEILKNLREWIAQHKTEEVFVLLETQFDVFEREYEFDIQETRYNNIDLSDPDAIWSFLRDSSKASGFSAFLLDTVKYFLIIPNTRRIGDNMWLNCQYSLRLATAYVREDTDLKKFFDFVNATPPKDSKTKDEKEDQFIE